MPHQKIAIEPVEKSPASRRTDSPLFFGQETEWDMSNHVQIPLTTDLPAVTPVQGYTQERLRKLFKQRIHENEVGLRLAFVNKHDAPHMDRVANGTLHMGRYLGLPHTEVYATALAARFHDVGYEFPKDADLATIEGLGKALHADHAKRGAQLVADAIVNLRESDNFVQKELSDWTPDTIQAAYDGVRLHSNSVGTDDSATPVSLLPRFIDKIDNISDRVRPSHLDTFHKASFRTVQHIQQKVQSGCRRLLEKVDIPVDKRHWLPLEDVRERLKAVEPHYVHQLAPAAVTHQKLFLNPEEVSAVLEYRVYPSKISDALQVDYHNSDHLKDFYRAYDRSFMNAANVMLRLREALSAKPFSGEKLLTVRMVYEDGRQCVLDYGPDLFS